MNTFYNGAHRFYCGVDLHKKTLYLCILNERGETVFHKNIRSRGDDFLRAIAPFREDLVVAVECMFAWYWLADLCRREEIVLGHALYLRAVHGLKTNVPPRRTQDRPPSAGRQLPDGLRLPSRVASHTRALAPARQIRPPSR